ncbi:MAG: hypothetical protein BGO68_01325 [Candidatus Amoebophilus sp. 36-38]|nr:MAG: hypothetical protein BGO68_01325 [Candidatus Amoebophilus sp. 36-38]
MKQNYNLRQSLRACTFLLSLFLQSCDSSFDSPLPDVEETKNSNSKLTNQIVTKDPVVKELAAEKKEDKEVQYNLGQMYEQGEGVKKDEERATALYIKAANQGYWKASNTLSKLALEENELAQEWVIDKGDRDIQYTIGQMYEQGRGVKKDEDRAVEWYQKSANQGRADAQNSLDLMYKQEEEQLDPLGKECQEELAAEKEDKEVQ